MCDPLGVPREKPRDIVRERIETGWWVGKNGVIVARGCQPRCDASTIERKERNGTAKWNTLAEHGLVGEVKSWMEQ